MLLSALRFEFGIHCICLILMSEGVFMIATHSDSLVFFGITGDLAYKPIFPALQAMIRRGHLDIPIIGVAGRPWTIKQLQAHVHDSLEEHGGVDSAAFTKLCSLLQYVSGDYHSAATYTK